MATWADLVAYVRANFRIAEERPNMVKLDFSVGRVRSQAVFLWRLTLSGGTEEWVQIESPFGKLDSVDLPRALRRIGSTVCGGVAQSGEMATFRHAVPLLHLDVNELRRPLALVTATADELERLLTGTDRY